MNLEPDGTGPSPAGPGARPAPLWHALHDVALNKGPSPWRRPSALAPAAAHSVLNSVRPSSTRAAAAASAFGSGASRPCACMGRETSIAMPSQMSGEGRGTAGALRGKEQGIKARRQWSRCRPLASWNIRYVPDCADLPLTRTCVPGEHAREKRSSAAASEPFRCLRSLPCDARPGVLDLHEGWPLDAREKATAAPTMLVFTWCPGSDSNRHGVTSKGF